VSTHLVGTTPWSVFIAAHGIGRGYGDDTRGDRIRMHIKQTCNVLVLKEKTDKQWDRWPLNYLSRQRERRG
jgi:hypothetical protein